MEIQARKLTGVYEITPLPKFDQRGFFMRTYDEELFKQYGLDRHWVQENHSRSERSGIIRGLHFQFPPFAETKLIRCIKGTIWDIFVDLRKGSPTFGQWDALEISEDNKKMVFIPRGFAHGFCTISDVSEVVYKVDNWYSAKNEGGLLWCDSDLNIEWPVKQPILSAKDNINMKLADFIDRYGSIEVS